VHKDNVTMFATQLLFVDFEYDSSTSFV